MTAGAAAAAHQSLLLVLVMLLNARTLHAMPCRPFAAGVNVGLQWRCCMQ